MNAARFLPLALLGVMLLSGCAAGDSDTPDTSGATLADSKGIVQLVRNEAGSRLPAESVAEVKLVDDSSEACLAEAEDPERKLRRWASTSVVTMTAEAAAGLEATYSDLIQSFVGNGWSEVSYGGGGAATLMKPDQDASIGFAATKADEAAATPPTIRITIHSGCVATDGETSDEVTTLEAAK